LRTGAYCRRTWLERRCNRGSSVWVPRGQVNIEVAIELAWYNRRFGARQRRRTLESNSRINAAIYPQSNPGLALNPSPTKQTLNALENTRAVLFDLDGTLLDTAPDMVGALNQLRSEGNRAPLPYEEVRQLVSHGATALVRLAFAEADKDAFAVLRKRFLEIYRGRLSLETQVYEGMKEALGRLESAGIAWGIVTNKPGWLTEPLLEHFALSQRAGVIVCGDTLTQCKPHPAPLLHAAKQLGVTAAQCIYIGDAERDVMAAQAAGMKVFVALFGYIQANERPREWPASGWLESPQAMAKLLESIGSSM
jgi:2-phosphoglycolate phosphatase